MAKAGDEPAIDIEARALRRERLQNRAAQVRDALARECGNRMFAGQS